MTYFKRDRSALLLAILYKLVYKDSEHHDSKEPRLEQVSEAQPPGNFRTYREMGISVGQSLAFCSLCAAQVDSGHQRTSE